MTTKTKKILLVIVSGVILVSVSAFIVLSFDKDALILSQQNMAENSVSAITQNHYEEDVSLIPGGQSFGVKFYTDGVMVVDMTAFDTENGIKNPAFDAGIRIRDMIISMNGEKITSNEDVARIVTQSNGEPLTVEVKRNSSTFTVSVIPQKSTAQGSYKIGLWVRDSTAGIGTITYINPENGHFAGLGHAISDVDTGLLMPLARGEVIGADITGVVRGQKGTPGQLKGTFLNEVVFGWLADNTAQGIFGVTKNDTLLSGAPILTADSSEVHTGDATIRCTIDGTTVQEYTAVIESLNKNSAARTKNLIIRITDPLLLEKTGGIVQGMSGSPIIQDGKLIGAITHVLISEPTMGYGIFIENMLETEYATDFAA